MGIDSLDTLAFVLLVILDWFVRLDKFVVFD